jgi:hypothetical protein
MEEKDHAKRGEQVLELEPEQVIELDLIMTRRQLSDSEETAALLKLQLLKTELAQIQREKVLRSRDEAIMMTRLAQAAGVERFKRLRVIGRNKVAYEE